jgi:hypothetical protein
MVHNSNANLAQVAHRIIMLHALTWLKNRVRVLLLGCNIDERGVVMNGAGRESGTHGYY